MVRRPVAVVGEGACTLVGSAPGIVTGARQYIGHCSSVAERRSRPVAADFVDTVVDTVAEPVAGLLVVAGAPAGLVGSFPVAAFLFLGRRLR